MHWFSTLFISASGLLFTLKQALRYKKPYKTHYSSVFAEKLITVFTNEAVVEYFAIIRKFTG